MGGKVECYVDCASPYSYFGMKYLRDRRHLLKQYDIELDFIPFFLGGVNVATGNKPPSTLPAKAAYSPYDLKRAAQFFNSPLMTAPPFFPMLSLLPQRCMIAVKSAHPRDRYEAAYETCWIYCFHEHRDLSKPEIMVQCLRQNFSDKEVEEIMRLAGTKEIKDQLLTNTKEAVARGAFGAPWFWLTNSEGKSEPMFGSDRFSQMFHFMGVDVVELTIVDKKGGSGSAKL